MTTNTNKAQHSGKRLMHFFNICTFFILFFLSAAANGHSPQNIMQINDLDAVVGGIITIEVEINNDEEFVGFNLDIPIPENFTFVMGSEQLFRKTDHSFGFVVLEHNNVAKIIAFSLTNAPFLGNEGLIFSFDLQTPETPGEYVFEIHDAVIGTTGMQNILTGTLDGTISLTEPVYLLTLLANPEEGGVVTGEGAYNLDEEVAIEAIPNTGWVFAGWTGDIQYLDNANAAETSLAMPANNVQLIANFEVLLADPVFDLPAGNYFEDQTVFIDNYDDYAETVKVYYSLDGEDPDAGSLLYDDETGIQLIDGDGPVTLKAVAIYDEDQSEVTEAEYVFPINVEDIATLRTFVRDGDLYRLTGGAIITLQGEQSRNQRFIQDDNAGILIDDKNGVLGEYDMGDVLANLIGTVGVFNSMLQFVPAVDHATVVESGVFPDPLTVDIDELNDDLQGMLIRVEELTYQGAPGVFAAGQSYLFHDKDDNALTIHTVFSDLDYIGTPIPEAPLNITGVHLVFGTTLQIVPRSLDDFEEIETETPEELLLAGNEDVTIGAGEIECFFSLGSIVVAGGDYEFVVEDGGNVELAASESITMLPGTKVESGGYLHAYIADESPCGIPAAKEEEVITIIDPMEETRFRPFFKVYPNPTTGEFTVELLNEIPSNQPVRIEVYNLMGTMVASEELPAESQYRMNLQGQQPGMYLIRVFVDEQTGLERLIKR